MSYDDFLAKHSPDIQALLSATEPQFGVSEEEFAERVYSSCRSVSDEELTGFISQLKASDLCLAIACGKGDSIAWSEFDTGHRSTMIAAARKLTRDQAEAEDLTQAVYAELFGVRETGEEASSKLAHYSGRGSLGGWLRAVIYQAFINRTRQSARFEQTEDANEFERLANKAQNQITTPISGPDEELIASDGSRLRHLAENAIQQALKGLGTRDRLVLNYYYLDDLTLKEIGVLFGTHEATVSRWVTKIHGALRKKVEEILKAKGLRKREVDECLAQAAHSEIDLRQVIAESRGAATERAP